MTEQNLLPDASADVLEEVARAYEASLTLPKEKQHPQWMLMPVGLLASGKTTVVKPLSEYFGLVRISTDDIRERLKVSGHSYAGAREIARDLTQKYLGLGYSIALDANTGSSEGLKHTQETMEKFPDLRKIYIHINPPDAFIIEKLKHYQHSWLFKDAEHAIESFEKYKKDFVLPEVPFVYTFDTSRADLPGQLQKGIKAIEATLNSAR